MRQARGLTAVELAKRTKVTTGSVNDDVRLDTAAHPLFNAVHQRILQSMTSSASSKLSRSDFVQWPFIGKRKDIHLYDELAYAPAVFFRAR